MGGSTVYIHPEHLAPPTQHSSYKLEFAAVNPKFQGEMYKTAYAIGFGDAFLVGTSIVQLDVENKVFVKKWKIRTATHQNQSLSPGQDQPGKMTGLSSPPV